MNEVSGRSRQGGHTGPALPTVDDPDLNILLVDLELLGDLLVRNLGLARAERREREAPDLPRQVLLVETESGKRVGRVGLKPHGPLLEGGRLEEFEELERRGGLGGLNSREGEEGRVVEERRETEGEQESRLDGGGGGGRCGEEGEVEEVVRVRGGATRREGRERACRSVAGETRAYGRGEKEQASGMEEAQARPK